MNPTTNTVTGDGFNFTINYAGGTDGQDVVLTAVAAPTDTWSGTDVADPTTTGPTPNNWVGGGPRWPGTR